MPLIHFEFHTTEAICLYCIRAHSGPSRNTGSASDISALQKSRVAGGYFSRIPCQYQVTIEAIE